MEPIQPAHCCGLRVGDRGSTSLRPISPCFSRAHRRSLQPRSEEVLSRVCEHNTTVRALVTVLLQIWPLGLSWRNLGSPALRGLLVTCRLSCGDGRPFRVSSLLASGGLWAAVLVYVTWRVGLPNLNVGSCGVVLLILASPLLLACPPRQAPGLLPGHRPPALHCSPVPQPGRGSGTAGIDRRAPASRSAQGLLPGPLGHAADILWAAAGARSIHQGLLCPQTQV